MATSDFRHTASEKISLRPSAEDESEFLTRVYASTRKDEMAAWGWSPAQQEAFIKMQFDARRRGYMASYPEAETNLVYLGDVPVGSLVTSRGPGEIRLLDISLLPEFCNRGIGGELISMLIAEAAPLNSAVRLSVARGNRAAHLYERLGFVATGGDAVYCEMQCST